MAHEGRSACSGSIEYNMNDSDDSHSILAVDHLILLSEESAGSFVFGFICLLFSLSGDCNGVIDLISYFLSSVSPLFGFSEDGCQFS